MRVPGNTDLRSVCGAPAARRAFGSVPPSTRGPSFNEAIAQRDALISKLRSALSQTLTQAKQAQALAEENKRLRAALAQAQSAAQTAWRAGGRRVEQPQAVAPTSVEEASVEASQGEVVEGEVLEGNPFVEPDGDDLF